MPEFVATDVLETAVQVSLHRGRQRQQHLPAQERAIACERIDDLDTHLLDLFRVDLEVLEVRFAYERVAEHFHQTIFGKLVGHLTLMQLIVGESDMAFHRGMRDSYRNTVVPIDAGHFLHQIAGCGEIGTPAGAVTENSPLPPPATLHPISVRISLILLMSRSSEVSRFTSPALKAIGWPRLTLFTSRGVSLAFASPYLVSKSTAI